MSSSLRHLQDRRTQAEHQERRFSATVFRLVVGVFILVSILIKHL